MDIPSVKTGQQLNITVEGILYVPPKAHPSDYVRYCRYSQAATAATAMSCPGVRPQHVPQVRLPHLGGAHRHGKGPRPLLHKRHSFDADRRPVVDEDARQLEFVPPAAALRHQHQAEGTGRGLAGRQAGRLGGMQAS